MDDIAVLLEHVHLLNRLDGLHVEFLQRCLQLLVIGARGLVNFLLFPPWCAFAPEISQVSSPNLLCENILCYELRGVRGQ